jgi:hypothetical protein
MRLVSAIVVALAAFVLHASATEYGPVPAPQPPMPPQPVNNPNNRWNFRSWLSNAFQRTPQAELSCKYTDAASGTSYDLTRLRRPIGDYSGADMRFKYAMNFCGVANTPGPCALHKGSVCQFSTLSGSYIANLGSWSNNPPPKWEIADPSNPSNGVTLTYSNGDTCFINRAVVPRKTVVHLACGSREDSTFSVSEIPNMCTFNIRLSSPAACGVSTGSSWFVPFLVITFLLVAVYIGAGCYYNVKYKEKQWGKLETIPNYEFWLTVPGYAAAGATWTYETAAERWREWRNKDGGSYARVAGSEEDAAPDTAADDDKGFEDL